MPMHDWTRVPHGAYHTLHQLWAAKICRALNQRLLPPDYYADTLSEESLSLPRKSVVPIRNMHDDEVVAFVELVSPGNRSAADPFAAFVGKVAGLLGDGVHVLVVDPFPPTPRDPGGVHAAIWAELGGRPAPPLPAGEPLMAVAYRAGEPVQACGEPFAVGASVPEMPVFLRGDRSVMLPLEEAYCSAFAAVPAKTRRLLGAV